MLRFVLMNVDHMASFLHGNTCSQPFEISVIDRREKYHWCQCTASQERGLACTDSRERGLASIDSREQSEII